MVSRRELLAGGVMGGFVSQDSAEAMQAAKTIGEKLDRLEAQLRRSSGTLTTFANQGGWGA